MKRLWMTLGTVALVLSGCPSDKDHPIGPARSHINAPDESKTTTSFVSAANLGKRTTVEG